MSVPPKKKSIDVNADPDCDPNWADDQRERSYYYDDAYGYEEYKPESEEPDAESENTEDEDN